MSPEFTWEVVVEERTITAEQDRVGYVGNVSTPRFNIFEVIFIIMTYDIIIVWYFSMNGNLHGF